jgi:serine/threonine protein kinase
VSFEYREEEIRSLSDGKRYPVVLMDWVEGETLFQWAQHQCHNGDVAALAGAAQQWPAVVAELSREQIAHGDLQHANIMVTPQGTLKLVDYDGMCVPSLVGADSLELGTPPYQHPHRNASLRLSLRLDDFSALLIYVALESLAADPTLWGRYVEQTENDKLLFREDDFRFSEKSALRRDLLHSSEPHVRDIAECLFAAAAGDMDQVPVLGEIVARRRSRLPSAANGSQNRPQTTKVEAPSIRQPGDALSAKDGESGPPPLPAASMPRLRGYEMIARVGRGTLGSVFLAQSQSTGQRVAVKVIPIRTPATGLLRHRFLAEIDRVAQSRHPHIVGLLERGTVGHAFYFVTEYCDGGNIAQWMERNGGKLRSADIRPVMQQCLDALKYAHLRRLIHGNITPQNILVANTTVNPIGKLSDFALAKEFGRKFSSPSTMTVKPLIAGFLPPEQLTSEHGLNSRSDLWSLAAVFYYTLTGAYPWDFRGRNPFDVISREEPVPLLEREDSVPLAVAQVIDRALRPNPAHRYQSAAEMKAAWDVAF